MRIVALVDDDAGLRVAIANLLRSMGCEVATFASAEEFLSYPNRAAIRCLLLDLGLPGMSGQELLVQLRATGSSMPIICVTGQLDPGGRLANEARQAGAQAVLYKPFDSAALLQILAAHDIPHTQAGPSRQTRGS